MSEKFSIDKGTTISISLVISIIAVAFFVGMLNAETNRNSEDITAVFTKLESFNENLSETNGNLIELNTRLDAITRESVSLTVEKSSTPSVRVVVVPPQSNSRLQTASNPQTQPTPEPNPEPEPTDSEPPLVALLQAAPCSVLGVFCN